VSWLNPIAWIGLVAVGVPILIHLLSRRTARVQRFPSLRFLDQSPLVAPRRAKLTDLALLALRAAVITAAVAALAQPVLQTAERRAASGRLLTRAVILDTSASMLRETNGAAAEAQRLADEATTSVLLSTGSPARQFDGAASWLAQQSGRREIVVVSDFQAGAIDARDIASLPVDIGVRLVQVDVREGGDTVQSRVRIGANDVVAHATLTSEATIVEWTTGPSRISAVRVPVVLTGESERRRAGAAFAAAMAVTAHGMRTSPIEPTIVFPGYASRAELVRAARRVRRPESGDAIVSLRRDEPLANAAAGAVVVDSSTLPAAFVVVARTAAGRAVVAAAENAEGNLLVLSLVDAGSVASAALISAVSRAMAPRDGASEASPVRLRAGELRALERSSENVTAQRAGANDSDGRWLWVLVLVLLAIETIVRRSPRFGERVA
jgi:hypothetical protein